MPPEYVFHASARKHYRHHSLTDEAVLHAVNQAMDTVPLDDDDNPRRWLVLGPDTSGRILEVVLLTFDDGLTMIIHAMKARKTYLRFLRN